MSNETVAAGKGWQRPFFTIFTGQAFSLLGSSLVQFALVWWLTQTTGKATVLAMATLVAVLPSVLIAPFAGALVDRWNRRLVMIFADVAVTVGSLVLIYLFWSGHIQVWHVYCIVFVRAMGGIFQWSAMQASISLMVPQAHLARIAGLNQALRGATSIAAPAMGAFLLQALPMYGVLAVDVLTALMAIVPLMVVRIPQPVHAQAPSGSAVRTLLTDVWAGMRYLIAWPALLMLMLMAMLINFLFTPTDTLLPLLITQHFKGDVWHLGLIQSAFGGGVVAGGLLLSVWGGFSRRIYTTLFGLIGMSVGILLVGVAPANGFLLAVAGMMLCGVMMPITNGPVQAIIQARVAPEMQGRIFMLLESMATAMMPLSMLAAGPISDWLGIRIWYLLGGAGTLLMGIGAFFVPLILNIEHDSAPAIRAAAQPADLPPCPDCAH